MAATSDGDNSKKHPVSSSLLQHFEHLQPLAAHRIRWFYKEDDKWKPFDGADSLNIEKAYRYFKDVQNSEQEDDGIDLTSAVCTTVRGALYEADVLDRECRPLYWREPSVPIRRGTWFIADIPGKWETFDENESTLIEEGHMQFLNSLGLGGGTGKSGTSSPISSENVIHQIKLGSSRVEWHDISEVYIVSESTGSKLVQRIGFSGPRRLNRGFEEDCDEKDGLGQITHLVFMVHGIGQLYYGEGGIINSRKKLLKTLKRGVLKPSFADGERVEFFPIEWRTNLKLDEGIIDSITPKNLESLRKMLNATTMDVLYYASPLYREEIIQTIREKLNLVYKQFCDRNPAFEINGGKVSIIAHSLGSVIMHDMLTLWNSYLLEKDKNNADEHMAPESSSSWWGWKVFKKEEKKRKESAAEMQTKTLMEELHNARLKVSELEAKLNAVSVSKYNIYRDDTYSLLFKVENVFNIGSPLGVFLVMRGVRPRLDMEQHLLPTSVCKRTHNIYDPSDPIAYRLEPLIYGHYSSIPPVRLSTLDSAAPPTSSKGGWFKSLFASKPKTNSNEILFSDIQSSEEMDTESRDEAIEETTNINKVLRHRIDYVLEPSLVEYFSAITAHQAYWQNADFAKFVIQVLSATDDDKMDVASRL